MPLRYLREEILTSERVNQLTLGAEVFYRRLMSAADDYGRFDGRPIVLRAKLYPLRYDKVSEKEIEQWKQECANADLITLYEVDGKEYLNIERFKQRIRSNREKVLFPSKFPNPPEVLNDARHLPVICPSSVRQMPADIRTYGHTDIRTNKPPNPLAVAKGELSSKKVKSNVSFVDMIPEEFKKHSQLVDILHIWIDKRSKDKKKMTAHAFQLQIKRLQGWLVTHGKDQAISSIENSIANDWSGIFEPKNTVYKKDHQPKSSEKQRFNDAEYNKKAEQAIDNQRKEFELTEDYLREIASDCKVIDTKHPSGICGSTRFKLESLNQEQRRKLLTLANGASAKINQYYKSLST